jgi:hypothetical protein
MYTIDADDFCNAANRAHTVVRVVREPCHVKVAATITRIFTRSSWTMTVQIDGIWGRNDALNDVKMRSDDTATTVKASIIARTSFEKRHFIVRKIASRDATELMINIHKPTSSIRY